MFLVLSFLSLLSPNFSQSMAFISSSSSHSLTPCFVAPTFHSRINLLSWIWPYFQLCALISLYVNTAKHLFPWQPLLPWLFCFFRGTWESTWHSFSCHLIAGTSLGSTSSSSLSVLSVSQMFARPFSRVQSPLIFNTSTHATGKWTHQSSRYPNLGPEKQSPFILPCSPQPIGSKPSCFHL